MSAPDRAKLHTHFIGIPASARASGKPWIGMDTKHQREGLHLWIGMHKDDCDNGCIETFNVHLSREDARRLVEEITERLF